MTDDWWIWTVLALIFIGCLSIGWYLRGVFYDDTRARFSRLKKGWSKRLKF